MLACWQYVQMVKVDGNLEYLAGQILYPTKIADYINQYMEAQYPIHYQDFYVCPELFAGVCSSSLAILHQWGIFKADKARTRKKSIGRIEQFGTQEQLYQVELILPHPNEQNIYQMPDGFTPLHLLFKTKERKISSIKTRVNDIKVWLSSKLELDYDFAMLNWGELISPNEYFHWIRKCSELESKYSILELQNNNLLAKFNSEQNVMEEDINEEAMENSALQQQEETIEIVNCVSNHLRKELKSMETAKKHKYNSFKDIAESKNGAGDAADLLSESQKEDAINCPSLFRILIPLLMSQREFNRVCSDKNSSVWESLLNMEFVPALDYIGEYSEDPNNFKIAAKMDVVQSCADMICHILLNCRGKGQTPLEWIFTISTLLKTSHADGAVIDLLNKVRK